MSDLTTLYLSRTARTYKYTPHPSTSTTTSMTDPSPASIKSFHHSLPNFATTPLLSIPSIASTLSISQLLLKCEFSRLGLPAFKILGASWGVYRALCEVLGESPDPERFGAERMRNVIREREGTGEVDRVRLFAATDGNHGRAVARMARILLGAGRDGDEARCMIYVPDGMYESTKVLIEGEGATVVTVNGDYDEAVAQCWTVSQKTPGGVMVQDNAFEGYQVVPGWIVEGYRTLLEEVDGQFGAIKGSEGRHITHVVTPIGVGSLGHAVVKWAKAMNRERSVRVITVEPETAGCLNVSLRNGESTTIETEDTIMSGMCCGTVSPTSWEALRDGVDCSVAVGDWEAHETLLELEGYGVEGGPCGAGCLAGLRKVLGQPEVRGALEIDEESVVVVLCTEGRREYPVPRRPSS